MTDSINIKKYWVEKQECTASRLCIAESPSMFDITYSEVGEISQASKQQNIFSEEQQRLIADAAIVCPFSAIKIELLDGSIHDGDSEKILSYVKSYRHVPNAS